jgi:hypothetical protein
VAAPSTSGCALTQAQLDGMIKRSQHLGFPRARRWPTCVIVRELQWIACEMLTLSPDRCSRSRALCAEVGSRPWNLTFKRGVYTRRESLYTVYSDGHAEDSRDRNLRLGARGRAL